MRVFISKILFLSPLLFLNACISISSLQTARTNEEGKFTGSVALGSIGIRILKQADSSEGRSFQRLVESVRIPVIEGGLRYGFLDRMDGGLRLALIPGSYGADVKYQLSGFGGPFATAIGLGIDHTSYSSSSGEYKYSSSLTDLGIPLYLSYDFAALTSVYLNPRVGMRMSSFESSSAGTGSNSSGSTQFFGAALGFAYKWFVMEYAFVAYSGSESAAVTDQISLGIRIATGNLKQWSKVSKEDSPQIPEESDGERSPPASKKVKSKKKKAI